MTDRLKVAVLASYCLLVVLASFPAGAGETSAPLDLSRVELKKVQEFYYDEKKFPELLVPHNVHATKKHVFVSACFPVKLSIFGRDPRTELLKRASILDHEKHYRAINKSSEHAFALMASGRDDILYVSGHHFHAGNHSFGIHWYKIDEKSGAARHLGSLKTPKSARGSNAWGSIAISSDKANLYFFDAGTHTILWYRLEKDGKPVLAGDVKGKGLITSIKMLRLARGPWAISPDDRFVYSFNAEQGALGWAKLAKDGKPEYGASVDIVKPMGLDPQTYNKGYLGFVIGKLSMSPDGRHLYMSYTYKNRFGAAVFSRDAKKGSVSFLRKLNLGKSGKRGKLVLNSSGTGGFFYTGAKTGTVGYFSRNAQTGDLKVEKTIRFQGTGHQKGFAVMTDVAVSSSGRACYVTDNGRHKSGALHVYKLVEKGK